MIPKPLIEQIVKMRECSKVERCHTIPHFREYSVGIHSFDCLLLLYDLYPGDPPPRLVKAITFHDFPERWVGDLPAPAKWYNEHVRKHHGDAELAAIARHNLPAFTLSEDEQKWLDAIDRLESLIWATEQKFGFGNRNVEGMITQLHKWFLTKFHEHLLPMPVWDVYSDYQWHRGPET